MSRYQTLHYRKNIKSCPDIVSVPLLLNADQCLELINAGEAEGFEAAHTIPEVEGGEGGYRITEEWYPLEENYEWLYTKIAQTIINVNHQHYQFDITGLEPVTVLKYEHQENGQEPHYAWHRDAGGDYTAYRKLSIVIHLNDEYQYDGGKLEYFSEGIKSPQDIRMGTAHIFPAWLNHRVLPVTRGVRYTAVCWSTGLRFR